MEKSFSEFGLYPDKEEPILGSLLMIILKTKLVHIYIKIQHQGYVHIELM